MSDLCMWMPGLHLALKRVTGFYSVVISLPRVAATANKPLYLSRAPQRCVVTHICLSIEGSSLTQPPCVSCLASSL